MTPQAIEQLKLERFPKTSDQTLRAWNSADSYLINHVAENIDLDINANILIINDQFGALACAFSKFSPFIWTDSYLSGQAIEQNTSFNQLDKPNRFSFNLSSEQNNQLTFDLILIRIPKHNSLLDYQLKSLQPFVNNQTTIIAGGMTKEIHNSTISLFEKRVGKTKTSLALKKARLIFSKFENKNANNETSVKTYKEPQYGVTSYGMPGVFSREKLDIGTRVLLDYLPKTKDNQKIIDLGCGTGILGTTLKKLKNNIQVTFCDESYLAIESAKLTYSNNINKPQTNDTAVFLVSDVLDGVTNKHFDHILCNPPFHQQNVQTLSIANKMFKQSALKLKETGELRVVANRHLKYKVILESYFKNVKSISSDAKFIVWLASNPRL